MERFRYDRSSKWLIEHHSDSILRLAGIDDVVAWRPLPAEIVQPRQLPDGLVEVQRRGRTESDLYLIEIETYADVRIAEQIMDDLMMIYQTRRILPETILLVLRPKGQTEVLGEHQVRSVTGHTQMSGRWPVIELWKLSADAMLALRDPGLVPWIVLMESTQPPEQLLKECRKIIDERAKPEELGNLLVVSQVLAGLRYNQQWLFKIFGGKQAMIESPLLKELIDEISAQEIMAKGMAKGLAEGEAKGEAKAMHRTILRLLKKRFGAVSSELTAALTRISSIDELDELTDWALACADLESFRQKLSK